MMYDYEITPAVYFAYVLFYSPYQRLKLLLTVTYLCFMSTGRETMGCFSAPRTALGCPFIANSWWLQLYLELLCQALAITSLKFPQQGVIEPARTHSLLLSISFSNSRITKVGFGTSFQQRWSQTLLSITLIKFFFFTVRSGLSLKKTCVAVLLGTRG